MPVDRIKDFNIKAAGQSVIVYGNTNDCFILENLRIVSLDHLLWIYLKRNGYNRIVFIEPDITKGLYTLDSESFRLLNLNDAQNNNTVDQEQDQKLNDMGWETDRHWRAETREAPPNNQIVADRVDNRQDEDGNYIADVRSGPAILELILLLMAQPGKAAFIFMQFESFFIRPNHVMAGHMEMFINTFNERLKNHKYSHNDFFYVYGNYQSPSRIYDHIDARQINFLKNLFNEDNRSFKNENSSLLIKTPKADEIERMINHQRIAKDKDLRWEDYPVIAEAIEDLEKELSSTKRALENVSQISTNNLHKECKLSLSLNTLDPLEELNRLIGLEKVKEQVSTHIATSEQARKDPDSMPTFSMHMIFRGNPGTGKTEVANLIARIYKRKGILTKGKAHVVSSSDLIAGYVGQTPERAMNEYKKAIGGVLFIDEAYTISESVGGMGKEALDTLTKFMDENRDKVLVIAAGYPKPMDDFLESNPGLKRRFPNIIDFEDYNATDLLNIFDLFNKKTKRNVSEPFRGRLKRIFKHLYDRRDESFGNAGLARNIFEASIQNHQTRCLQNGIRNLSDEPLIPEDLPEQYLFITNPERAQKDLESALIELNRLIGLKKIKSFIRNLSKEIKDDSWLLEQGIESKKTSHNFNFIFSGNPGTGKTMVAKILGEKIFKALGISNGKFLEATREDFVSGYAGQTATKTKKAIKEVLGGVLFIDEVYGLKQNEHDSTGQEAIDTLVKEMDRYKNQIHVIIAGYPAELERFLETNPGLSSRFKSGGTINFEDYSSGELVQICELASGKTFTADLRNNLKPVFTKEKKKAKGRNFGNGRIARELAEKILSCQKRRITYILKQANGNISDEEKTELVNTLTTEDIPADLQHIKAGIGRHYESAQEELESLIGLKNVKQEIKSFINLRKLDKERHYEKTRPHMVFQGNPGTGKTHVARLLGQILKEAGVLSSGHTIEASKDEITGSALGDAERNIKRLANTAKGGILFIDEAYSLADDQYGKSAIDILIQIMENQRDDILVVLAGYTDRMKDLLKVNIGLEKRIRCFLDFEDYKPDELYKIFLMNLKTDGLKLHDDTIGYIKNAIKDIYRLRDRNFANARSMESFVQAIRQRYADRTANDEKREPLVLKEDIPEEYRPNEKTHEELNSALDNLDDMVGLESVKSRLRAAIANITAQQKRIQLGLVEEEDSFNLNFIFVGNPGTGKTTVARKFGTILKTLGILKSDEVMEVGKSDLESGYVGQTSDKVAELIENAIGKTLFIDEAYQLTRSIYSGNSSGHGQEAIDVLTQKLTDPRVMGTTCIIAAGYPAEMQQFLDKNSGLTRRFNDPIIFEDYSNKELVEIFRLNLVKRKFNFSERILELAEAWFMSKPRGKNFGNASVAEELYKKVRSNLDARIGKITNPDAATLMTILEEDMPKISSSKSHEEKQQYTKKLPDRINLPLSKNQETAKGKKLKEIAKPSLGMIIVSTPEGEMTGTGFLVNSLGYIITCNHVIENATKIIFRKEISKEEVIAEILYANEERDLAILKIEEENTPYIELIDQKEELEEMDEVILVGYPMGEDLSKNASYYGGKINGFLNRENGLRLIQTNVEATHGASGAPLFRAQDNKVIGVLSGGLANEKTHAASFNMVFDIRQLYELIDVLTITSK